MRDVGDVGDVRDARYVRDVGDVRDVRDVRDVMSPATGGLIKRLLDSSQAGIQRISGNQMAGFQLSIVWQPDCWT